MRCNARARERAGVVPVSRRKIFGTVRKTPGDRSRISFAYDFDTDSTNDRPVAPRIPETIFSRGAHTNREEKVSTNGIVMTKSVCHSRPRASSARYSNPSAAARVSSSASSPSLTDTLLPRFCNVDKHRIRLQKLWI